MANHTDISIRGDRPDLNCADARAGAKRMTDPLRDRRLEAATQWAFVLAAVVAMGVLVALLAVVTGAC